MSLNKDSFNSSRFLFETYIAANGEVFPGLGSDCVQTLIQNELVSLPFEHS